VVFLFTKKDLFEKKFSKIPLGKCFPDFLGSTVQESSEFFLDMFKNKIPKNKQVFSFVVDLAKSDEVLVLINEICGIVFQEESFFIPLFNQAFIIMFSSLSELCDLHLERQTLLNC
jgi:hypothetical protein